MPSILESLGTALSGKLVEKLNLSGGTLTGPLVVPEPTESNHVATSGQVVTLETAIGNYGDYVASSADVTVSIYDTAANILARTGDPKGAIAVASDTNAIYYWSGAVWTVSDIDNIQADSLAAARTLNISADTEINIRSREGDATGTVMYGTDTDKLYIFDGSDWHEYQPAAA
jgi:hypothetical protein